MTKAGDFFLLWANQAERAGEVLAVLDDVALVEYSMPKGTSALRFYKTGGRKPLYIGRVSYLDLPSKWVEAIVHQGALEDLVGKPQQLGKSEKITINVCPNFKFVKVDDHGRD